MALQYSSSVKLSSWWDAFAVIIVLICSLLSLDIPIQLNALDTTLSDFYICYSCYLICYWALYLFLLLLLLWRSVCCWCYYFNVLTFDPQYSSSSWIVVLLLNTRKLFLFKWEIWFFSTWTFFYLKIYLMEIGMSLNN